MCLLIFARHNVTLDCMGCHEYMLPRKTVIQMNKVSTCAISVCSSAIIM